MTDGGEPSAGPKAIASLAKRASDVTRQGTQKLKFVPTLPARRKKEDVKQAAPQPSVQAPDKGDGRGRGRGRGRGGEGRGAAPRPPPVEMTATGPFAMGPALAGIPARRSTPRSNFTPVNPQGVAKGPTSGPNLSGSATPTLKEGKQRENRLADPAEPPKTESDEEAYSEPDEGVEIIDMDNVRQLDWMAPESLQRERRGGRKGMRVKRETEEAALLSPPQGNLHRASLDPTGSHGPSGPHVEDVDSSNALDLSDSEEGELEDLIQDFVMEPSMAEEGIRQERLYFFQFPEPFPAFASTPEPAREVDTGISDAGPSTRKRKVSFAADVGLAASAAESSTPPAQVSSGEPKETSKVDGVIGHVEVYRSGAVKMRLGNGIVLDVSEATQPSFLQQAVHLDVENKKLHVLGEISRRFVVSPDLDVLLTSMEVADSGDNMLDDGNLIQTESD